MVHGYCDFCSVCGKLHQKLYIFVCSFAMKILHEFTCNFAEVIVPYHNASSECTVMCLQLDNIAVFN